MSDSSQLDRINGKVTQAGIQDLSSNADWELPQELNEPVSRQQPTMIAPEEPGETGGKIRRIRIVGDQWSTTYAVYVPTSMVNQQQGTSSHSLAETSIDFRVDDGVPMYRFLLGKLFQGDGVGFNAVHLETPTCGHTSDDKLVELEQYAGIDDQSCFRIKEARKLKDVSESTKPILAPRCGEFKPGTLTVVIDNGGEWRKEGLIPRRKSPIPNEHINNLVLVGDSLPAVDANEQFLSPAWQTLSNEYSSNTVVIVSSTLLRKEGAHISRQVSWEQTIIDTLKEFRHYEKLQPWNRFEHVIVRFGQTGALYLHGPPEEKRGILVYNPDTLDSFYSSKNGSGQIQSKSSLLSIGIVEQLQSTTRGTDLSTVICEGIRNGLARINYRFDKGYLSRERISELAAGCSQLSPDQHRQNLYPDIVSISEALDRNGGKLANYIKRISTIQCTSAYELVREMGTSNHARGKCTGDWEIYREEINSSIKDTCGLVNFAEAVVHFGHQAIINANLYEDVENLRLNRSIRNVLCRPRYEMEALDLHCDRRLQETERKIRNESIVDLFGKTETKFSMPVLVCGKLTCIDREEIESVRGIRNIVEGYLQHPTKRPLSIAVFGYPGSGKTFAVEQIAKSFGKDVPFIEENLSQFTSVAEFSGVIDKIRNENLNGKTPFVFLDEFDCNFEQHENGWLKYFLAPMQDGTFSIGRQSVLVGKAVFVFAGGTSPTFEAFAKKDGDSSLERFQAAKGPDFVSRLRGHMDVLPLSPKDSQVEIPILKRAIFLRSTLEQLGYVEQQADDLWHAKIDPDIAYALLTIDRYHHGARSVKAVLEMCTRFHDQISKVSLPAKRQLNMHVNVEEFFKRMDLSRARGSVVAT